MCSVMTVFAGDINANEQGVLDAAEGTFEYGGKTYVATQAAKDRIRNYLMQDGVDLTADQASKAISEAFGNLEQGISQGYLVPAPGQSAESGTGQQPGEDEEPDPEQSSDAPSDQRGVGTPGTEDADTSEGTGIAGDDFGDSAQGGDTAGDAADSVLPDKMTKEEEDALIASILEKEGLEAEENTGGGEAAEEEAAETSKEEKDEKLPREINVGMMAVVVVVIVFAAAGVILYRHKNRFKR